MINESGWVVKTKDVTGDYGYAGIEVNRHGRYDVYAPGVGNIGNYVSLKSAIKKLNRIFPEWESVIIEDNR